MSSITQLGLYHLQELSFLVVWTSRQNKVMTIKMGGLPEHCDYFLYVPPPCSNLTIN